MKDKDILKCVDEVILKLKKGNTKKSYDDVNYFLVELNKYKENRQRLAKEERRNTREFLKVIEYMGVKID